MIVPTANYPTSRDYRQLWELAHTAAVVCIVDMDHGKPDTCRDIARTVHSPEWSPELVQVGSRGIGHVWAESLEAFIAGCEQCNLEWLVPPAALAPPAGEGPSERIISIAKAVQEHAFGWEPDARLIGNVCAEDVADLCGAILAHQPCPIAPPAPEVGWPSDDELLAMRSWSSHGPTFDSDLVDFGRRCYNLAKQPVSTPYKLPAPQAPEVGEFELTPREVEAQEAFTQLRDELLNLLDGVEVNEVLGIIDNHTPEWV
jgi:hypothetical protein